jgi:hypothetical protein
MINLWPKVGSAVILFATLQSCDPAPQAGNSARLTEYQRFVPIAPDPLGWAGRPWHGMFALDTRTGQLCKTIPWSLQGQGLQSVLNNAPLCKTLVEADLGSRKIVTEKELEKLIEQK